MPSNKPSPKSQVQLSQDTVNVYQAGSASGSAVPINDLKKRELQRSVKGDDTSRFSLGLKDIDQTIFHYFPR